MRIPGRRVAILVLLAGAMPPPAPAQAPPIRRIVDRWLTCVECTNHELDSVRVLGRQVPATVDTLSRDLFYGPSPDRRDRLTRQLETTWQRLADAAAHDTTRTPPVFDQPAFVEYYLGNMVEIYQGRAARGLGAIGGTTARNLLDRALAQPAGTFPPGVVSQIRFARDSLAP